MKHCLKNLTICYSCLMHLDCGFIYEGLWSDFLQQLKRCDFMLSSALPQCLSSLLTESNSSYCLDMKSTNKNLMTDFHRAPLNVRFVNTISQILDFPKM